MNSGFEMVIVALSSSPAYAVGSPSVATVNIESDDAVPVITVTATDATAGESGTGQGSGTFSFSRTGSTAGTLNVNFSVGGTATPGTDYTTLVSPVQFAVGASTATKTVTVLDDLLSEGDETVTVTIVDAASYDVGVPGSATVTIKDAGGDIIIDNASPSGIAYVGTWTASTTQPGYWATDYRHDGNTSKGTKSATFTPALPSAGWYQVFMWYPARSTYATSVPVDIVHAGGTATLTINQQVNGGVWNLLGTYDFNAGSAGYVRIRTTGTSGYVVADAVKFVPAAAPPVEVTVAATDAEAGEPGTGKNGGTFTFNRTGSTAAALTANYTLGGTASCGSDYTCPPLPATITFAAGSATATQTLLVLDDALVEGNETIIATVTPGAGYSVGTPSSATITVEDDDSAPTPYVIVDNADASGMTFVGAWSVSTSTSGYWGSNYAHDQNTGKGSKTATFTPNLPSAGQYQVFMRYPARSDYPNNVPVDIAHAGGTTTVTVDQRVNGGTWNLLGTFNFNAGNAG